MTTVSSYKISSPLILNTENKWNEWLDRFKDVVEAYGWMDEVTDRSKKTNWPLAKDLLLSSTEKYDHPRIRACDNLCDALEALKDAHHVSNQVDAIQLLKALHDIKLRPDEDVRSVVSRVEAICNNLASTGKIIDDDTKLTHVINVLSQNSAYKVTLDHMLATATTSITLKDLVRGFNVMHARASVVPGALLAKEDKDPFESLFKKLNTKMEEGMANLAKKVESVEKFQHKRNHGGNNRGGRGGRGGGRGGFGNGARGGRGNNYRNDRFHPYGDKEDKFDANCDNCGRYGHRARVCYKPCRICKDPSHNVTRCPRNPRMPSNQAYAPGRNEGRGAYNRPPPRANVAQAHTSGYLYNAFHGEAPSNDVEDFAPSAHVGGTLW